MFRDSGNHQHERMARFPYGAGKPVRSGSQYVDVAGALLAGLLGAQVMQLALALTLPRVTWLQPYQGKGEANPRAKLDADKVRRIRARTGEGYAEKAPILAIELGVCEKTIWLIRQRKRWGHVE